MATETISRKLARFLHELTFDKLPAEVVERAKSLVLDALSVAIAGRDQPFHKMALEVVKNNKGKASVFASGQKLPALDAAMVNAIMINSITQDDMLWILHGGQVVFPTTVAMAEEQGSSGAEIITALVAGYDTMARIYVGAPSIIPRFRGVPAFGPFGAVAAAGKLLKLNENQMASALGYAANVAGGLSESGGAGTVELKFHCGFAARNGILAAALARQGAIAAETSFEGKAGFYKAFAGTNEGLDIVTRDLGKKFYIMDVTYKPFPVCGTNEVPVALVLDLVKKNNIKAEEIDRVVETFPEWGSSYPGVNFAGPFTTRFQTTMSAQFCAAAAFLGKPVALISFFDKHFDDPDVAKLAKRIEVLGEKNRDKTKIEVFLKNGKKFSAEAAAGEIVHSELLEPAPERVKAKFDALTADFLGKEKADKIYNIVMNLDKAANISQLTKELA